MVLGERDEEAGLSSYAAKLVRDKVFGGVEHRIKCELALRGTSRTRVGRLRPAACSCSTTDPAEE
eukprot:820692-Rhodomonas_salina.2